MQDLVFVFMNFGELQGFSFIVVDTEDAFCKNTE